jgi:hypothetical protein
LLRKNEEITQIEFTFTSPRKLKIKIIYKAFLKIFLLKSRRGIGDRNGQ